MVAPVVPFAEPDPGDGRGVPNLLIGPHTTAASGSQTSYLRIPDRDGTVWNTIVVELATSAAEALQAAGTETGPVWPLTVREAGVVKWDGLTSVDGAQAVTLSDTVTASWVSDPAGIHACLIGRDPATPPDELVAPLIHAGVVTGWADAAGHERRWLLDNVLCVRPQADVRPAESVHDIQSGLAFLTGHPSVGLMLAPANYDPLPRISRFGVVEFKRVRPAAAAIPNWVRSSVLVHRLSPVVGDGGVQDVIASGVLLSQRRRRTLGIRRDLSWHQTPDVHQGVAGLVFAEVDDVAAPLPPVGLVWQDPWRLFARLDSVAVPHDPWVRLHAARLTPNPLFTLDATGTTLDRSDPSIVVPQVAVTGGIDLFGPHGPDLIMVRDDVERSECLHLIHRRGVDEIAGRDIMDVVQVHPMMAEFAQLA